MRPLPEGLTLDAGSHSSPDDGMCVMEAWAWMHGEWSDMPTGAEPRLAYLLQRINDDGGDGARAALVDALPYMVGLGRDMQVRLCASIESRILREVAVRPTPDPYGVGPAIDGVVALLDRRARGDEPTAEQWSAVRSVVGFAAWSAAGSAAWSAAGSARSAAGSAWSAAWVRIAEIVKDCAINGPEGGGD